jgi:hypothetical protein
MRAPNTHAYYVNAPQARFLSSGLILVLAVVLPGLLAFLVAAISSPTFAVSLTAFLR